MKKATIQRGRSQSSLQYQNSGNEDKIHIVGQFLDKQIQTQRPMKVVRLYQAFRKEHPDFEFPEDPPRAFRGLAEGAGFIVERANRASHWMIRRRVKGTRFAEELGTHTYGEPIMSMYAMKAQSYDGWVHAALDRADLSSRKFVNREPIYKQVKVSNNNLTDAMITNSIKRVRRYELKRIWDKDKKVWVQSIRKLPKYNRIRGKEAPTEHDGCLSLDGKIIMGFE